jgi:glutathione S-transferase
MPTSTLCGSPGPNNDKIGGVPTLHYFDFMSRGRGQAVRLLWEVRY